MNSPKIVSRAEWQVARRELLAKEKEFSRQRDALSAERRKLPMVRIEKEYVFEGAAGKTNLLGLFAGCRQLIIYHFMFQPDWEEGCPYCSHLADSFGTAYLHLPARDTAFAVVSRAPLVKLRSFEQRMGWTFPWFSSNDSDFTYDFHVTLDEGRGSSEYNYQDAATLRQAGSIWVEKGDLPGLSVFFGDGDSVFHSYSTYQRGLDPLMNSYNLLDLTPLGRHEEGQQFTMGWVRHHDKYVAPSAGTVAAR